MSEWKECKLSEFVQFGNGKERPKTEGDIPVFGGNGVSGHCDKSNYDGETIIIGRVGAYCGSVYYQYKPIWVSDNALVARPKNNYNTKFLYYFLKNLDLNSFAEGSSHPLVTQTLLNSLDIYVTSDLGAQTAIAEVLSSLDDKIDLLHRQNKTLEQLAETLFRQWFVEEAEEGWEVGKVEDLFVLQRGFDLPSQNRNKGVYPIIASNGINGYHDEFKIKGPGVTTGRSGVLGKVIYTQEDFWPLNTTLFIKEYKIATPLFAYFFLKTLDLETLNGGSAVPTLNRNHVHEIATILPNHKAVIDFEKIVAVNFQKIKSNAQQIHTLTQLRDTLLPKLMSGEVRVNLKNSK